MITYTALISRPNHFYRLTGHTKEEFIYILDKFHSAYGEYLRGRNLQELITEFPKLVELGILGDGTERPTRKPKNKDNRKSWYSGKKKHHTRKNILLARPDNQAVLYLGKTKDGSVHDKTAI